MKGNIFDKRGIVPPSLDREQGREVFETLLSRPLPEGQPLRVERIMSFGQEHGMWYDQSWDEWVMVMRGEAALEWGDGTTEHLTYVSAEGSDTFQFYSNQELADLALTFYQGGGSAQDSQNLTASAQTNDDGSVSIQVYENLGDHNSTAAWYTVDRTTAAGTDGSGGTVDLDSE